MTWSWRRVILNGRMIPRICKNYTLETLNKTCLVIIAIGGDYYQETTMIIIALKYYGYVLCARMFASIGIRPVAAEPANVLILA